MATIKDWVRDNDAAWGWIKANGYETFAEYDELVNGVDSGLITEEQLYYEDGFNFPQMPADYKSREEINMEEEEKFKAEHPEFADVDPSQITVIVGNFADAVKNMSGKKIK